MHMIAIAWLFIVILMAVTERSAVAGVATIVFYGVLPLGLFLYLGDAFRSRFMSERAHRRDRQDAEPDQ